MTKYTILHAGPPIFVGENVPAHAKRNHRSNSIRKLATDISQAEELINSGKIILSPCHDYSAVGGMTGITSATMPLLLSK